jgi:hypothetical protein
MKERNEWKHLSESFLDSAEQFQKRADEWRDVAVSCQEDNKRLIAHEEEMLAKMKELEKQRDMWRARAEEENRQAETYRGMLKSAEVG